MTWSKRRFWGVVPGFLGAVALCLCCQTLLHSDEPKRVEWTYAPQQLRPFWEGTVMEGESVLFIKPTPQGEARASVLFPIEEVLSVTNSAGNVTYESGRDYNWKSGSREVTIPAGSRIPCSTPSDLRRP
ncbi:MAG: hypothetical protein EHM42_06710, partial [Planctomycetaceae bacterium]